MSYPKVYSNIYAWFQRHLRALKVFMLLYHLFPALAVLFYADLLWLVIVNGGRTMILKVILVPFLTFAGVSLFRKCIDAPRPYTKYEITPLIQKDKQGESMPSRHTASFTIIAMAWLYVNKTAGCVMLVFALGMGLLRVLGGVHFVRDVLAAYGIAVAAGIIGFFIL